MATEKATPGVPTTCCGQTPVRDLACTRAIWAGAFIDLALIIVAGMAEFLVFRLHCQATAPAGKGC